MSIPVGEKEETACYSKVSSAERNYRYRSSQLYRCGRFLVPICIVSACIAYGKSAKDSFRDGERLLKQKDPYKTFSAFAEATKLDPRYG